MKILTLSSCILWTSGFYEQWRRLINIPLYLIESWFSKLEK